MRPEVLAPAGNLDSLIAAVYSGADAVYFGADKFNARRKAEGFSGENLENAIKFCRKNGVKSYLTLNTLIKDNEINEAVSLAYEAHCFGIDGVIVQDIGLAKTLKSLYPGLPLHASTQLSVHSPAPLPLLKELGFSRVVPAREMSRSELFDLCQEAKRLNMEVEVFVHGALCMCLSGQCYFSAHLGGRSANRGLCAGTCRLPFSAKGGSGYDLSLKDLSLVEYVSELEKMGVCSFKIEGRMKRAEYVASAVSCLRSAIDNGAADKNDLQLLQRVFSRSGFTDGYYTGNLGRDMFGIRTELDASLSGETFSKLHSLYRRPRQKIPVDFTVILKENKRVSLKAECEGYTVLETADPPQKAINRPTGYEELNKALSKLGGTPYLLNTLTSEIDPGIMVPTSVLNNLKKAVTEKLDELRTAVSHIKIREFHYSVEPLQKKVEGFFLRFQNTAQLVDFHSDIEGYSIPAEELVKKECLDPLPKANNPALSPAAELPRGASDDSYTVSLLKKLKSLGIKTVVCGNLGAVALAKAEGFEVFGGFGLNLFNSLSIKTSKELGINSGVISAELSIAEINRLGFDGFKAFAFCYGRFPLMLTRNCPVKNGVGCRNKEKGCYITDRKNEVFPVLCRNGYSEILNSRPTNLADSISEISADFGYLYFTNERPDEVQRVIKGFECGQITSSPFTRALSKNGVL